tara:strand:+ start:835 stop:1809 length:975 start_codon:yes stop_codon:yes gene_type:complete
MSTIEVDKVIPQSGTALQVGEAGDTVNIVGTLQNNGAELTGDISSVVAGTGLAGGGTTGDVTLNIEAAQPTVTSTGTLAGFTSTGIDDNATSTAITIDSSENIGIGTTSPASLGSNITTLEITGGSTVRTGGLYLSSSDKNIKGYWYGSNTGYAFGTETASDLKFVTTNTERVRIHSDGVMSAVNGVALGVGTANTASNVLDDYEEGTWTAGVNQGTVNNIASSYIKVGDKVTVWSNIDTFSNRTSTETVEVSGLPFAIASATQGKAVGSVLIRYSDKLVSGSYSRSSSAIGFYASIAGGYVPLKFNDLNNSSANMTFIATYTV